MLAIGLAVVAGPPGRGLARAPQDGTGKRCSHERFIKPGIHASVVIDDGELKPVVPPVLEDFDPARKIKFSRTLTAVSKGRDASISASLRMEPARREDNRMVRELRVGPEANAAVVGFNIAELGDEKCCHSGLFDAFGTFRGVLSVDIPHAGVDAAVHLGQAPDFPAKQEAIITYDDNCNLVPDSREEILKVYVKLEVAKDLRGRPAQWKLTGYLENETKELVDNVLVSRVVGRADLAAGGEARGKNVTRPLDHRPYGASALAKKFFFESRAELKASEIKLSAQSFRADQVFPFPGLTVDGSWFTGGLKAVDVTESLTAEIRK